MIVTKQIEIVQKRTSNVRSMHFCTPGVHIPPPRLGTAVLLYPPMSTLPATLESTEHALLHMERKAAKAG